MRDSERILLISMIHRLRAVSEEETMQRRFQFMLMSNEMLIIAVSLMLWEKEREN